MSFENYTKIEHDDGRIEFIPKVVDMDWVPEKGEKLFYVDWEGAPVQVSNLAAARIGKLITFHNCFKTEEQAKKAAEYMRRSNAIIRACLLVDPDFVPDWDYYEQEKWSCEWYNHDINKWCISPATANTLAPAYVSTKEKAEQVRDVLVKWGVK